MATMEGNVTKKITSEVDLFGLIMQQNIIDNEFNREYTPLSTIQHGAPIEFMAKGSNDLYLDLNNSLLHVLAKITNADGSNIGAKMAGPINLPLHSMFREISVELNGQNVSDTSPLYLYRAYLETLLNFSKETEDTSPVRGLDKRQFRKHKCHRSRRGQCRSEHSRRDIRDKDRGRTCRSPSPGRVPSISPNSSCYRSPHEVDPGC